MSHFWKSSPIEVTSAPGHPELTATAGRRDGSWYGIPRSRISDAPPVRSSVPRRARAMRQAETDFLSSPRRGLNIIFGHGPMGRNSGLDSGISCPSQLYPRSRFCVKTHEPTTVATPQIEFNINAVHPQVGFPSGVPPHPNLDSSTGLSASARAVQWQATKLPPVLRIWSVSQDFVPDAAYPSRDVVTDRAPAQVDRFFRPRPRGPVTREFSDFEAPGVRPRQPLQSHPAVCDLPRPETSIRSLRP